MEKSSKDGCELSTPKLDASKHQQKFEQTVLSTDDAEQAATAVQMYDLADSSSKRMTPNVSKDDKLSKKSKKLMKCPKCIQLGFVNWFSAPFKLRRHILVNHRPVSHVQQRQEYECKFCPYFSFDKDGLYYHSAVLHQPQVKLKRLYAMKTTFV